MYKDSKGMIKNIIDSIESTRDIMSEELNRQKDKLLDKDGSIAEALLSAERMTVDMLEKAQTESEEKVLNLMENKEKQFNDLMEKFSKKG